MTSSSSKSPLSLLAVAALLTAACGGSSSSSYSGGPAPTGATTGAPKPDPRVGLRAGAADAAEATWNLRVLSRTPPAEKFVGQTNSDLAFLGSYAIQGNYNGWQIWDISNPSRPTLRTAYVCPASQSDVSVYKNLLFISGEGLSGRLDCGTQGVKDTVSQDRLRGLRIFDISDIANPRNVGNVQTCRGSHTHSVLVDPKDPENVYVYISGSAGVRSPSELAGCSQAQPENDPNSALFRIEVIKVPLAHPEQAAIVSSPRIFQDLKAPPEHGNAPEDIAADEKRLTEAKARGDYTAVIFGRERVLPTGFTRPMLDSIVKARNGTGAPTGADSAALRTALPGIIEKLVGSQSDDSEHGPTQCHDITLYPEIGLAGGACEGYGFLIDIRNPTNPVRIGAVSDSNFSFWHSATFNNDGTKILFSDEWGGGGQPKCRATDKPEWGADAIFTVAERKMQFRSYYKLPAAQTSLENCVAHNGSLIPIPGRDVMVQAWYQGGISVFDWTDPAHPREIAFFDRGPVDSTRMAGGGSWSAYWYNGVIVSSEISRGLDIFELAPSPFMSQNEIDAAKSVRFDYFNTQGQRKFVWPASFALTRAYVDQLERSSGLSTARIAAVRQALAGAEQASGGARKSALTQLATQLDADARGSKDSARVKSLAGAVRDLAAAS
ncbi:MAG: LVIVD repeat-containing protein [Gemmatimonadales bacterium]